MPRYRLTLEYDGTGFYGWQRQVDRPSIQQAVEEAFARFCTGNPSVQAAGRTDAGVHALGQVIHVDLNRDWEPFRIFEAFNFHLRPLAIAATSCERVDDRFEARFSAKGRHYLYRILSRRGRPALDAHRVWHVPLPLDAEAMHDAAQLALGTHDFTTFRDANCQAKSPLKTLDRLDVSRVGDEIYLRAEARSFLHHQVRSLVGSLKLVGEGKWQPADFGAALAARDRTRCGAMAPPDGLYLERVIY
ncbi:MAG: pseudouridine synthase [Devosia sp.]|nr:pseudouridine synthase [Devosia sp.]